MGLHNTHYLVWRNIHNTLRFTTVCGHAYFAELSGHLLAVFERTSQNELLCLRIAHVGPELLVFDVGRAKAVTVHQQCWCAVKVDKRRVIQKCSAGTSAEILNQQK